MEILDFIFGTVRSLWRSLDDLQQAVIVYAGILILLLILYCICRPKKEPPKCKYCSDHYEILCKRPQVNDSIYLRAQICPVCGKRLPVPPDNQIGDE